MTYNMEVITCAIDGDFNKLQKLWKKHCHEIDINFTFRKLYTPQPLTPLYLATVNGDDKMLSYLIETCNADINHRHGINKTALMAAVVPLSVNQHKFEGSTGFHTETQSNYKCVKILLEMGADTTIKNDNGETAHDIAKKYPEFPEVIDLFEGPMIKSAAKT